VKAARELGEAGISRGSRKKSSLGQSALEEAEKGAREGRQH